MPFVYALHMYLAMSGIGDWILGIVALIWTIDCFVGFYLTLPTPTDRSRKGFLARWKPAWLVKWRGSSAYRINFDLHRAFGLWLWLMLFIFAWSSVYMDLNTVYTRVTELVLDYEPPIWARADFKPPEAAGRKQMSWEEAQAAGERLIQEVAHKHHFSIESPLALNHQKEQGSYLYRARSSRDIGDKDGLTYVVFNAYSGELISASVPTGERSGTTVTSWLFALHTANLFGMPYKIFVCALGFIIAMLSGTGVYIWWRKRRARKRHAIGAAHPAVLAETG